jgi:hypothetical protein
MQKESLLDLVLKGVALALAVAVVLLGYLKVTSVETNVALLGLGLFALALSVFNGRKQA